MTTPDATRWLAPPQGPRMSKRIVQVAAVAENGVIGLDGDIPWSIPEDLKHFRAVTRGNTVVMGRRTFESIGHPLPYRSNIVVTRDRGWSRDGVFVAHDIDEAIALAQDFDGDVMVIGGAQIYAAAMDRATHQSSPRCTRARRRHDVPGLGPASGSRPSGSATRASTSCGGSAPERGHSTEAMNSSAATSIMAVSAISRTGCTPKSNHGENVAASLAISAGSSVSTTAKPPWPSTRPRNSLNVAPSEGAHLPNTCGNGLRSPRSCSHGLST